MAPRPRPIWRAIRPGNVIMTVIAVLIGASLASGDALQAKVSVYLSAVSAGLLLGFSNVYNDIRDVPIDERKGRSPGYQLGSRNDMYLMCIGLISVSGILMIAGILLDRSVLPSLIYIAAIPAVMIYESSLKERGLLGNITVGVLIGSSFLFGGSHHAIFDPAVLTLSAMAFFGTISREIVKDIQDMPFDEGHRRTLPMICGPRTASLIALFPATLSAVISLYPILILGWGPIFIGLVVLADISLIASIVSTIGDENKASMAQRTIKYSMVLVMIAFVSMITGL